MKRLAIAALMLAALAVLIVPVAAQNTLSVGTTTGSLAAGETVSYTLDVTAGEFYTLSLITSDFDSYLNVEDAAGDYVSSDDDGGQGSNALAVFKALETATYTVEVSSYSSSSSGDYTLVVTNTVTDVSVGTPATLNVANGEVQVFQFEATAGAYTIVANSGEKIDTNLSLVDSIGIIIDETPDDLSVDPAFQRIVIADGEYYLVLVPYDLEASGEVVLEIVATEAKILNAEPTSFTFNESARDDIATFEVEAGKTYLITVTSTTGEAGDFSMYIEAEDSSIFTFANFSFSSGLGGSFLYVPDVTGALRANISGGFYSGEEQDEYTVTLVEQAE